MRIDCRGIRAKAGRLAGFKIFIFGRKASVILLEFLTAQSSALLFFPNLIFFLAFKNDVAYLKISILNMLSFRFDNFLVLLASFQSGRRTGSTASPLILRITVTFQ